MKLTRRQLAAELTSAAALAQTPAPPASPEAELQSARDQVKAIAATLIEQDVPMSTEPAFSFQA
jgi:hypothetical protein